MKKAAIFSALGPKTFSPGQIKALRQNLDVHFITCLKPLAPARFIRWAKPFSILGITRRTLKDFGPTLVDLLPELEGVALYATGFEWVDARYFKKKKISLAYLPDYSTSTVAEHALACLLTLSRRIHLSFDKSRLLVPASVSLRGWELFGKTLGIVGYGRIGKRVALLAKAFGMKVLWTDGKSQRPLRGDGLGRLLERSDALVLCSSKQRKGSPLLGPRQLNRVKRGAVLVNVGRSSLVDTQALIPLLRKKWIGGYAVDDSLSELRNPGGVEPGRVLQTCHTGWYSNEAIARGTQAWVDNLVALGRGQVLHPVPAVKT